MDEPTLPTAGSGDGVRDKATDLGMARDGLEVGPLVLFLWQNHNRYSKCSVKIIIAILFSNDECQIVSIHRCVCLCVCVSVPVYLCACVKTL